MYDQNYYIRKYNPIFKETILNMCSDLNYSNRQRLAALTEAQNFTISDKMLAALYQACLNKYSIIDFGDIPSSKGDIDKLPKIKDIIETLNIIKQLAPEMEEIKIIEETMNGLRQHKKEFILSYVQEQGTSLKMIYETIVLSIYCVLTIAMNGALDYVKTPNGNISHSMNTQYSANPQYRFLLDNLNKFNKLVSKGELRKLCDAVLKKENFIGGALMTGIGIPKAITGVALVASAIMIIPVIRELLYLFYNFRMVTSEFFETQATLLELNIIELKNSNGKNADKIAKKQQKYVEKLRKLSNKFEIEFSKAEKQTKKELNTKISTDDISNLLIDTQENPSGFSFV